MEAFGLAGTSVENTRHNGIYIVSSEEAPPGRWKSKTCCISKRVWCMKSGSAEPREYSAGET
ncbi:hypothetical protein M406DRAFT_357712 [Cryphonectria parasitica EP155]|uniref:Uncharacterized protein n=1 Tax=Cryphonectria parasitica (strain ATCC 38755 / EP155) TaxID=660469 RepID=A0A9P5CJV6_CRYP1|nr:uncharacterized protein M406DRAFT_357712 [Cryphonectria parasitica EP155]KAF3761388.1 hypothetical protein M406DRAFT_357712 [Cryphonectria parasitica EP155]